MNVRLGVMIGVLVLLVGFWFFKRGSTPGQEQEEKVKIEVKCNVADCGNEAVVQMTPGFDRFKEFPKQCEKCNQKTAYQMVVCGGCQTHYPNDQSRQQVTKCTKCGTELPGE